MPSLHRRITRLDRNRVQFQEVLYFNFPRRSLRITIISAEFRDQCSAVAESWDRRRQRWNLIHSIPPADMDTPTCLHVSHDPSYASFSSDYEKMVDLFKRLR